MDPGTDYYLDVILVNFHLFFVLPLTLFHHQLIYNVGIFNVVLDVPYVAVLSQQQLTSWVAVLLRVILRIVMTRS